jgi:hypothetical protein
MSFEPHNQHSFEQDWMMDVIDLPVMVLKNDPTGSGSFAFDQIARKTRLYPIHLYVFQAMSAHSPFAA